MSLNGKILFPLLLLAVFTSGCGRRVNIKKAQAVETPPPVARGAMGALDEGFGVKGGVLTTIGLRDGINAIARTPEGKVVAAGYAFNGINYEFAVARYLANGALDPDFGIQGRVATAVGTDDDIAYGVAVQPDGRIIVVGKTCASRTAEGVQVWDWAIVQYRANGALDLSFNASGILKRNLNANDEAANSVFVRDGRIIVGGYSGTATDEDFLLMQILETGMLDTGFGAGGIVRDNLGQKEMIQAIAPGPNATIIAVGQARTTVANSKWRFAVARYRVNGSRDASGPNYVGFGASGFAIDAGGFSPDGTSTDFARSLAVSPDGKFVAAGYSANGTHYEIALMKFTATGILDSSFGAAGKKRATFGPPGLNTTAHAVGFQSDGKVVVAGDIYSGAMDNNGGAQRETLVARFTTAGAIDETFGNKGSVIVDFSSANLADSARALFIDVSDRITVGGHAATSAAATSTVFSLFRLWL